MVRFDRPEMLLALLLVPGAAWVGWRSGLAPRRRRWSVVLRAVVLVALALGLARPRIVRPVDALGVAFLLDVSDSVPAAERARGEVFASEAIARARRDDRAAVIAFGERALVDRAARSGPLDPVRSDPGGGRTDLGAALRLGLAVLPADTARRMVVVSDGRANLGRLDRQAELAAASGVPVDVVPLAASSSAEEVLVARLEAPANTRVGQRFDLVAVVRASAAGQARMQIYDDRAVVLDRDVDLAAGENRVSAPVTVAAPGFRRFRAVITPARDGRRENNQASAYSLVAGAPRVLVVADKAERAAPLVKALQDARRSPDLIAPDAMPRGLLGLIGYDSVVLVDTPARALSTDAMAALEAFVRDLGHGLVMVGGEDGFGAGGYKDTPIEKAMPVDMEVRDKERRPEIALALVVDRSGSMGECSDCGPTGGGTYGAGTRNKLDLAKEAVLQAGELLRDDDRVAVVAFDDQSYDVWPLQKHDDPGGFEQAVGGIQVGGGTNIFSGLEAGVDQLWDAGVPLKHLILLSDGWSDASGYEPVLQRMVARKITLSIVAVGEGSAPYLKELARAGGGRYYPVRDPGDVPQVFVEDTMTALGSFVIEERFQPVPGAPSDILSGIDPAALLPLGGYDGTTAKQSAQVVLWSHLEDPVLAQWQYGLGRAVAWTSDLKGQWASDWLAWPSFGAFAAQLVDWTLPAPDTTGFAAEARLDGGTADIALRATDAGSAALNALDVAAHLAGPGGESLSVPLRQTGAGEYHGLVDLPSEGTYLVRVVGRQDGSVVGAQTLGLVVPYSPEYADASDVPTDPRLVALAERTGGRVLGAPEDVFVPIPGVTSAADAWPWLFLLAALVFPVDVAVRRLKLRPGEAAAVLTGARARWKDRRSRVRTARDPVLEGLFAARARARERQVARAEPFAGAHRSREGPASASGAPVSLTGRSTAAAPAVSRATETPPDAPAAPVPDRPGEAEALPEPADDALARLRAAKRRARR
jgi:Mg-chelatase subunit ChlD